MNLSHVRKTVRGGRFALLFLLLSLSSCDEGPVGRADFVRSGCPRCHGSDLKGTRLGPPLKGLSQHWNRTRMEAFLAHPDSFRALDPRLARVAAAYPAPMPTFLMPDSLRGNLVIYLLSTAR